MKQIVAATLHNRRKIYYWWLPEGMTPPHPGMKVLVESQGGIAPAKVVKVIEAKNIDVIPSAALVLNESYDSWRKDHPSKKEIIFKEELRRWRDNGMDPATYIKAGYSSSQLREIRRGLELGLNVSIYADPALDPGQMEKIRRKEIARLGKALKLIPEGVSKKQLKELVEGMSQGMDISTFNDPALSWSEMRDRRLCFLSGALADDL